MAINGTSRDEIARHILSIIFGSSDTAVGLSLLERFFNPLSAEYCANSIPSFHEVLSIFGPLLGPTLSDLETQSLYMRLWRRVPLSPTRLLKNLNTKVIADEWLARRVENRRIKNRKRVRNF